MTERAADRCRRLEPLLSAWLDHSLSRGERAAVDDHLLACPHCRAEVEALRRTVTLLRSAPRRTMPADLQAALSAVLGAGDRPRAEVQGPGGAARVAAALLVLCGLLGASAWMAGADASDSPVAVPLDVFVVDHLERAPGAPAPVPVLVELGGLAGR
jgi:anti-sigma factor RsiW